jgi:membrane fusion protein (multidrug efflux system)
VALKLLNPDRKGPKPDLEASPGEVPAGPAASAASRFPRHLAAPAAIALTVIAALWFGGNWLVAGRFEITTDNAHIRSDITGIASKVQGYVATVHVSDNQQVKAGDLLVSLEDADFVVRQAEAQAALAQAEARVTAQEAAIQTAIGRAASQRDQLTEARAAADAADADADISAADAERFAGLAEQGWYPRARVEAAQAQERANRARSAQADAAITSTNSQLSSSQAAVAQARQELTATQAAVAAARARLEAANLELGRTQIRAPIDGVVANRVVAQGQLLSPGQTAMAIVPADNAYVVANFKETQVERMAPGQRVRLKVDAYPDLKVEGCVESLSPATGGTFSLIPQDTATGNFTKIVQRVPVRIALSREALDTGLMRSGLAVTATVQSNKTCG